MQIEDLHDLIKEVVVWKKQHYYNINPFTLFNTLIFARDEILRLQDREARAGSFKRELEIAQKTINILRGLNITTGLQKDLTTTGESLEEAQKEIKVLKEEVVRLLDQAKNTNKELDHQKKLVEVGTEDLWVRDIWKLRSERAEVKITQLESVLPTEIDKFAVETGKKELRAAQSKLAHLESVMSAEVDKSEELRAAQWMRDTWKSRHVEATDKIKRLEADLLLNCSTNRERYADVMERTKQLERARTDLTSRLHAANTLVAENAHKVNLLSNPVQPATDHFVENIANRVTGVAGPMDVKHVSGYK